MLIGRRALITGAAALAPTLAAAAASPLRERVVGAWRLRDAETVNAANGATTVWDGKPRPYTGLIIYAATGEMSVQIASRRPPTPASGDLLSYDAAIKIGFLESYYAYFGRFELDEAKMQVRHHILTSLDPNETGTTLTRNLALKDGVLILTTAEMSAGLQGETFNRLTWEKA